MMGSTSDKLPDGVFPVMLTPFRENKVDYDSLKRLVEWYIQSGAAGLFAACQSSEIIKNHGSGA